MAYFTDTDELYEYIGSLLEELVRDEDLGPRFRAADTIVQYRCSNPDGQITCRLIPGEEPRTDFGETDLEPEVVMSMDADVAHRFWLGMVNVTIALARAQVTATGPVTKILRLVPLAKPAFPRYRAKLEAAGRHDLVEVGLQSA